MPATNDINKNTADKILEEIDLKIPGISRKSRRRNFKIKHRYVGTQPARQPLQLKESGYATAYGL